MKNKALYVALLATIALAPACRKTFFEPEPANNPEAIFEDFWTSFQENYAPFAERGVDWQAQYDQFRPQVHAGISDDELHGILSQMIAALDDGHVTLTAPDRPVFFSNRYFNERIGDERFDLGVVKRHYLAGGFEATRDDDCVHGLLPDGNAYIFFRYVGSNWDVLNDLLEKYRDAKGLVVDLRHNLGGDFTYAFTNMGRLTAEKRLVFRSKTKNGPAAADFTPWHDWALEPKGEFCDKRIVVLTDRFTISAGERATMAFRTLPDAVLVGDTTNGGHSTMMGRELANGWKYTIATQKVQMADGRSYEGIGIAPDHVVRNHPAELANGYDAVLEKAMKLLQD